MKKTKKMFHLMVTFALIMVITQFVGIKASAAPRLRMATYVLKNNKISYGIDLSEEDLSDHGYKITSVKSSNSSVAKIEFYTNTDGTKSYCFKPKNKGTATIAVKIKKGKKTTTLKQKVTVSTEKPFRSIKYGTKEIYKGKEYTVPDLTGKVTGGKKLSFDLKSSYKAFFICYVVGDKAHTVSPEKTSFKIDFKKKEPAYVFIEFKDAKEHYLSYIINLNMPVNAY